MPRPATPPALFDSHPTEPALIKQYLGPLLDGTLAPGAAPFVHETDLYAVDPADLTAVGLAPAVAQDGSAAWYFLTPLRLKSAGGAARRKARTVPGGGWWNSEAAPRPVFDALAGGRRVGSRQNFSFMRKDAAGAPFRTGWIMVELTLAADGDGQVGRRPGPGAGRVLCKVYRSPRHPGNPVALPRGKAEAAVDVDEEEPTAVTSAVLERRGKARDGGIVSGAAATPATPGREEKPAGEGEDEDSAETSAAAPPSRKRKAAAAADEEDEDSDGAPPARKRTAAVDEEASRAASVAEPAPARGTNPDGGNGAAAQGTKLQCPSCGYHVGTLTLNAGPVTAAANSGSDGGIVRGGDAGGSSEKDRAFHRFL